MADFTANSSTSTSGLPVLLAKTIDTVVNFSPFMAYALSHQKKWRGTQLQIPIKWAQNTQGIAYDGLQKFSTNKPNNYVNMLFTVQAREMPVVISGIEVDINASNPTIDLRKRQMESDAKDLATNVATDFFTKQAATASGALSFLSLIDGADNGSNVATYGGLARSSYTGLQGNWTGSVGALTTARMRTLINSASHGAMEPDLIVTDKTTWAYYEALLTATIQTMVVQNDVSGYKQFMSTGAITAPGSQIQGSQGFRAIEFAGRPVVADEFCQAGFMFFLNRDSWAFYGLKVTREGAVTIDAGDKLLKSSFEGQNFSEGFAFIGPYMPIDQYAEEGHILLQGNLVCENPRINGYLSGITS